MISSPRQVRKRWFDGNTPAVLWSADSAFTRENSIMQSFRLLLAVGFVLVCFGSAGRAAVTRFEFTLDREGVTSAGVYTPAGQLVRELWSLKRVPAGKQAATWDGLDDLGRNVPPGAYEVRVACSRAIYTCVGTIGNSGVGEPMQAGTDDLIIDRKTGEIYTANNWEEAGQDFRKMDADGKHLMDAGFGIRNGDPNGWPNAVAVEDGLLYCAVFAANDPQSGQLQGRNSRAATSSASSAPTRASQ